MNFEKSLTFNVRNLNEAPIGISLSSAIFSEFLSAGSTILTFSTSDPDVSNTFRYSLVSGDGSADNVAFSILGKQLIINSKPDFETKSSYSIRVRTTDQGLLNYERSFVLSVADVNEAPIDIALSASSFNENLSVGSAVLTLAAADPDRNNSFIYSLVSGTGSADNAAFFISGNKLNIKASPDYEAKSVYQIRVRTTDQGNLYYEKNIVLAVNNLVEKVSSSVSTTLAPNVDTLELTGTNDIAGLGNQYDNSITGNSGKNKLTGGMGKDILTGGGGFDAFFYNDFKQSLLSGFDVITDYTTGEQINLANPIFKRDSLIAGKGQASSLNAGAIGSVLTNTSFLANNAAAFTVEGLTGTFLALNDGRDGFQADSDALIHLSKYTIGSTTPISII